MAAPTLLDAVGLAGVAVLLVAYALTVAGRWRATQPAALAANMAGALLILASLWGAFSLASAVIEAAWAGIAAVGLVRHLRR